jgi:hypothetical protein
MGNGKVTATSGSKPVGSAPAFGRDFVYKLRKYSCTKFTVGHGARDRTKMPELVKRMSAAALGVDSALWYRGSRCHPRSKT